MGLGTGADLGKAVKIAKNIATSDLPSNLTVGGVPVPSGGVANSFAKHFNDKIKLNLSKTNVKINEVYNGKCKLIVQDRNFMSKADVKECLSNLPNKNVRGLIVYQYACYLMPVMYCLIPCLPFSQKFMPVVKYLINGKFQK